MNTDTTFVWHKKIKDIEENICIWKYSLMEKGACTLYSVMQLDGNSFCGDIVFGSYNMAFSDEDNNLEQKYEKQIFLDIYFEDFEF